MAARRSSNDDDVLAKILSIAALGEGVARWPARAPFSERPSRLGACIALTHDRLEVRAGGSVVYRDDRLRRESCRARGDMSG
jgi:hypothetical protein